MSKIHLFGTPRVAVSGRADILLSAREAGLLAWLHLAGPSPRARLAGLLWPGGDDAQARANLRQTLVRLKRAAGALLDEHDGVMRIAGSVSVVLPGAEAGPQETRLLGALEFDDAPEFAEWLSNRREAVDRERRREQLARARSHLQAGALDAALTAAEAVLALDGAVEEAHRLRIEVFYQRGDRAAAITAWDDCRDALRRAYGVTPSAATNELGRLVLAAEAAAMPSARHASALAAAALPAALRRPPRLAGREAEQAQIAQALSLGHGVVLAGPGGIGKSRLLAQTASAMEPALSAGGRPGDLHLPGVLVSRLLAAAIERFAPELDSATRADIVLLLPGGTERGQALGSALEHRRVLASVARTLAACQARGLRLLVVDDLQFVDELSLQALSVLVGRWLAETDPGAVLPMFGCRADELRPAAAALLQLMGSSHRCTRIDLTPLGTEDIETLLGSLPLDAGGAATLDQAALAQALHARVGGNPAFVLESVKALWLDRLGTPGGLAQWRPDQPLVVPATLRESLRQRLDRLGADALQLAQLAAVAQEDFSLALASAALGRPALSLAPLFAELEAAQLLDGIRFSHDLVAEAARAALPAALVAPMHQLVAGHLGSQGGSAARIAWHLQQAGDEFGAVPWHLAAAEAARERWQLADAAHHFEAAALGMAQQPGQASPRPAAGAPGVATIWLQAARWRTAVSDYPAALRALERGFANAPDVAERLELRASQIVVLLNSQAVAAATEQAQALAAELQQDGDALAPERLAAALFACVAVVPHAAQPQRLAALCDSLRARCEAGSPRARQSFHLSVGTCLNWLARPLEAHADLQQARRLAEDFADHGMVVNVTQQQLRNALLLGDLDAAQAASRDSQQAIQAGGFGRSFRLHGLASQVLVGVAAGRPDQALAALRSLQESLAGTDANAEAEVLAVRAVGWWAMGRADRAAQLLPPGDGWLALARWPLAAPGPDRLALLAAMARHWPAEEGVMGWRRRVLAALHDAPSLPDAEALVAELRQRALWPLARQAHGIAAQVSLSAGEPERAAAHARRALALAAHVDPWIDDAASVWGRAAAVFRAAGSASEADAALAAGRHWVARTAGSLSDAADREAWCRGHPLHRALLA